MGKVYYDEGSLEYAYMLYMKYMTLFLEKIRQHPEYTLVPSDWKIQTQAKIREILPKTEKIKKMLLEQYTKEYTRYMQEVVSINDGYKLVFIILNYFSYKHIFDNRTEIMILYINVINWIEDIYTKFF